MIKYTKVRNDFLERTDLSAEEKTILIYLHGRKRSDGQPWEVNAGQIRQTLNLGVYVTDKALASLKDKGWLTDNRGRVRGRDGRVRRDRSRVIPGRCGDVVAPDAHISPYTENRVSVFGPVMKDDLIKDRPLSVNDAGAGAPASTAPVRLGDPAPSRTESDSSSSDSSSSGDDCSLCCRCNEPSWPGHECLPARKGTWGFGGGAPAK